MVIGLNFIADTVDIYRQSMFIYKIIFIVPQFFKKNEQILKNPSTLSV